MNIVDGPQSPGPAVAARGKRFRSLVCWRRGHRWGDHGRERELIAIMCSRCQELVIVKHQAPSSTWDPSITLAAIDMLVGLAGGDGDWRKPRWTLIENPPAAVDTLGLLARWLSEAPPCRTLDELADVLRGAFRKSTLREVELDA